MKFKVRAATLYFIIALNFKVIDKIYLGVSVSRCIGLQYLVYSLGYTVKVRL